ncbi:hypothetical protein K2173_016591 [Erythroxylum novogranatense]|uniref:Alpha-ketoglutarate-dependent dioxygenase AlkB-like domain-containing protein n=1 Tax=Erythroxylum novogranatense TaxID=1862640 RepID=A0AAV8SGL5_9ROSI|nr:hypothetical protein K2173_016591 [Erythroxylum novogranatense]
MEGNLNKFKVGNLPSVFYIPEFITRLEETQLLAKIYEAPLSKWKSLKNRRLQNWGGVVHEKGLLPQDLPPWLTKITQKIYNESGLFPAAINHVLINEYLPDQGIMPHQDGPAYFPVVAILSLGSPVIMDFTPHSRLKTCTNAWSCDDENKLFSAGEALDTETNKLGLGHQPFSVLLMPRSLLIFKDDAYTDYLHGIEGREVQPYGEVVNGAETLLQRGLDDSLLDSEKDGDSNKGGDVKLIHRKTTRISLTCRSVLKVHKNLFKF